VGIRRGVGESNQQDALKTPKLLIFLQRKGSRAHEVCATRIFRASALDGFRRMHRGREGKADYTFGDANVCVRDMKTMLLDVR